MLFVAAGLWSFVYQWMKTEVQRSPQSIDVQRLVGTSAPKLMSIPRNQLLEGLANMSIDIGMCGIMFDISNIELFGMSSPSHMVSGLQIIDNSITQEPNVWALIVVMMSCIDNHVLLMFFLILCCVFVAGPLIALVENVLSPDTSQFRNSIFGGAQDGWWFAFIVIPTVGLGDLAPRTTAGRLLTLLLVFANIAFVTILYGIITNNYNNTTLIPVSQAESIAEPLDLATYNVGTTSATAADYLVNLMPQINVTLFGPLQQELLLAALIDNTIDVAVERYEVTLYYNNFHPLFKGQFISARPVFNLEPVGFGVSRPPGGGQHPISPLLSAAVVAATRADRWRTEQNQTQWIGPLGNPDSAGSGQAVAARTAAEGRAVDAANRQLLGCFAALVGAWAAVAALIWAPSLARLYALSEAHAAVTAVLRMSPGAADTIRGGKEAAEEALLVAVTRLTAEWCAEIAAESETSSSVTQESSADVGKVVSVAPGELFDTEVFFLVAAAEVAAARQRLPWLQRMLGPLSRAVHGVDGTSAVRRLFWLHFCARERYPLEPRFVAAEDAAETLAAVLAAGSHSRAQRLEALGEADTLEPTLEEALARIAGQLQDAAE